LGHRLRTSGGSRLEAGTALPQLVTEIDGPRHHFTHVNSPHEGTDCRFNSITQLARDRSSEMINGRVRPLRRTRRAHGRQRIRTRSNLVVPSIQGYGYRQAGGHRLGNPGQIARGLVVRESGSGTGRNSSPRGGDWGAVTRT